MAPERLCNRCGEAYGVNSPINKHHGQLELKLGRVEITAHLCQTCYDEMVEAYRSGSRGAGDS